MHQSVLEKADICEFSSTREEYTEEAHIINHKVLLLVRLVVISITWQIKLDSVQIQPTSRLLGGLGLVTAVSVTSESMGGASRHAY